MIDGQAIGKPGSLESAIWLSVRAPQSNMNGHTQLGPIAGAPIAAEGKWERLQRGGERWEWEKTYP